MTATLVWITPDAEKIIAYCARVSSPHQENPEYAKLLSFLIKHKHWSPFEMASMCVEITTSRLVSQQILRHRSFSFQEFSQRYSQAPQALVPMEARRQAASNRQASTDDLDAPVKAWFKAQQESMFYIAYCLYDEALAKGVARECARALLPLGVQTKLYMSGTIRSWLHYLEARLGPETQAEHREIAEGVAAILREQLPTVFAAGGWA